MYSIVQARRIRGAAGDPLPTVFQSFEQFKIIFRRGQLCLICAGPGTGKSALALTQAVRSRVPTLYMSADSDAFTQVSRSFSIHTGITMDETERYARGEEVLQSTLDRAEELKRIPVRFNFLAAPKLSNIEKSMEAFDELYGEYPALTVVDNITNVRNGTEDNAENPFGGLEVFLDYANEMARETQSCVIGLHHVNGPYNDQNKPIPMSGVKGQIGRVPQMILTLFRSGPGTVGVSPVKLRGAKFDPSGEYYTELDFDGSTMTFKDPDAGMPLAVPGGPATMDPFGDRDRRREEY
jgi:DnaB-like helicase C terminal domain